MLPGLKPAPNFWLTRLMWLLLLASAFLLLSALAAGRAEAEEALASWYGPGFQGLPTASGEPFDANAYTAAHKTLPFGTMLNVNYKGRSVMVRINDRGPYAGGRDLDLSQAAAQQIGLTQVGVDWVEYNIVGGGGTGTDSSGSPSSSTYPSSSPPDQTGTNGGATYVVQPGDALSRIANQLGTSTDNLAQQNSITNPNMIYSGQTLYFQAPGADQVGTGGGYGSPVGA